MRKIVRLTESDLHRIVEESVNKVLVEEGFGDRLKGAVAGFKQGDKKMRDEDERVRGGHRNLTQAALEAYKALQRNDIARAKQELCWGLSDNGFNGWNDGSGTEWRKEFQSLEYPNGY